MPGGDRTGPWGAGPMTGRGAGWCSGFSGPGYMNPLGGRGYGRGSFGRGGGRGWRHRYYATGIPGGWNVPGWYGYPAVAPYPVIDPKATADHEITLLRNQAQYMEEAIQEIRNRINELEKDTPSSEKE